MEIILGIIAVIFSVIIASGLFVTNDVDISDLDDYCEDEQTEGVKK